MRELSGKVAVVTGAASGIGRALADCFAAEGMRVVLADIETDPLRAAERELRESGAEVITVQTDVAKSESVADLADVTLERFGAVHVVCNNAGVSTSMGPVWERSLADWEWVLGVNLWGVIHGIRTFVPILLRQGVKAHIVNTASIAGLLAYPFPFMAIYDHALDSPFEIRFNPVASVRERARPKHQGYSARHWKSHSHLRSFWAKLR
jgi:NAD(P)-dependent dehydrogenase (short-subunit alcohol dehydrogenase family)